MHERLSRLRIRIAKGEHVSCRHMGGDPDCDCLPECPECGDTYQPSEGHECSTDDLPVHGSRSTSLRVWGGGLNTPEITKLKSEILKRIPKDCAIYDRVREEWCFPETTLRTFFSEVAAHAYHIPLSFDWRLEPNDWEEPETEGEVEE